MSTRVYLEDRNSAFSKRVQTFAIVNRNHIDIIEYLMDCFNFFETKVIDMIRKHNIIKVNVCFSAVFEKVIPSTDEQIEKKEKQTIYLNTRSEIFDITSDIDDFFDNSIVNFLVSKVDDVIMQGSGFTLSSISELSVQINKVDPINGSSYIPLPEFLRVKKAIVNVKNNDQLCFMWSVLSAIYHVIKNADRVNKYKKYKNVLNLTGIEFPMSLNQITKFEKNNPTISINVYYFDEILKKVLPLRITSNVCEKHIHLLLLIKNEQRHYCWIKNLGRLITSQITKHKSKYFYCDRCLNHFKNIHKLTAHKKDCSDQNECRVELPKNDNNKIFFKNIRNQLMSPFIIYADIETLLKKPSITFCNSKHTKAYQEHEPYSVGFYLKCSFDDTKSCYKSFRGPDCIDWFVKQLSSIANEAASIFSEKKPMKLTVDEENTFQMAETCHICEKKYDQHDIRVRDHSHLTGKFRGSAHQSCNIKYQEIRTIPVVFHNLSHYDAHFLMRKISSNPSGSISIIPINSENYISFSKTVDDSSDNYTERIKFKFIDSFRFMASSLDYLSTLLPAEKKLILQSENVNLDAEQMKMLERKGILCYDYLDSWDKLNQTSLPPKEMFFSKLTNEAIADDDYEFALKIWRDFRIKTLGDYCDLYLKVDVLLLADVFENFRQTCHTIYKLDPSNYYTSPGLSFDAMLKYTDVVIELLTDIDMLIFVEKGIRGGISQCSKRFVEANNKYMNDYNEQKESKYIMYPDCNNLYGYSMMQYLPLNNFKWSHETFNIEQILNLSDESKIGYLFEVDLEYPKELHKLHNDYPFCAESKNVPGKKNMKKLLLTLHDKSNYIIHYRMLKIVLQNGLILKCVHRVLQFNQSAWLKPYIDLNTEMRTKATNEFEKNFYKLLSNAIYGKTMENLRSRVDIQLKSKWNGRFGAAKLISKPNFKRSIVFDENLIGVEMARCSILMDKPIIVGMSILDISKVVMYDFYYNFLKTKYHENIEIAYTDTDSFVLEVKTDCFYIDMKNNLEKYDTSDYPIDNLFLLPRVNKKIPGVFKDEMKSEIITKFVGLRSKMYCVQTNGIDKMKKAKGVKRNVLKREISFKDYINCLQKQTTIVKTQNTFRSKLHNVYSIQQEKVALSPFDDKRFILKDNINTLAWGHCKLK